MLKILPLLKQFDDDEDCPVFDVVAPSLPNFGFSAGISKRGFGLSQYAETCHKLMLQLGYPQYVTQAGDWGFWITRTIGKLYPEACKASHYNMIFTLPPTITSDPVLWLRDKVTPRDEWDRKGEEKCSRFLKEGKGYNVLLSTKPQTLAYAVHDSPVALLAWVYEKLHGWSYNYPWTDEEILTWISIYAFSTAGPGASGRIYYEVTNAEENSEAGEEKKAFSYWDTLTYTKGLKIGLTHNPGELEAKPKLWGKTLGNVVYEAVNESGGHFYAYEVPDLVVRDLKAMFGRGGGAFGVVEGKNGVDK